MIEIDFNLAPRVNMAAFINAIYTSNGSGGAGSASDRVAAFFKAHVRMRPLIASNGEVENYVPWQSSLAAMRAHAANHGPTLSAQDITDALATAI